MTPGAGDAAAGAAPVRGDPASLGVAALGAGRMGRGIGLAFALAGESVLLVDVKTRSDAEFERLRESALAEIRAQAAALVELGLIPPGAVDKIIQRVDVCDRASVPARLGGIGLVFEGVPERMDAKAEAFAIACASLPHDAVVASTSSTFLSTALAGMVRDPRRFLNAHWLNPAHLIPLVELSPHPGTDPEVVRWLRQRLEGIGKVPVTCGAVPGYIVPRMQVLIMNEAARMIESGAASAEDIDRAIRFGFGLRYAAMGVVEFIDAGGNDILFYASRYLAETLGDSRYESPPIVGRLMADGHDGLRSGRGFYDWSGRDVGAYRRETTARFVALLRAAGQLPKAVDALGVQAGGTVLPSVPSPPD